MKIPLRARIALVTLALGVPVVSSAGPVEDARATYDSGDYPGAFRIWTQLAEQGNAEAQNWLGRMYLDGRGTTQDNVAAADWFRRAAEQGFAESQCNLGFAYSQGRGVIKDEAEAVRWYRKAAEQNFARCQDNLGVMYRDGRGVAKDEADAVAWFRKGAEQGNARAQTNLGFMYEFGRGVAKDDAEALLWYRRAAEQGYALGQNNLGVMYRDGRGVARDDATAISWFRKAADQGNTLAVKNLASMNEQGRSVAKADASGATVARPLPALAPISREAVLNVGRVALRLSDDGWENIGAGRRGLTFTGDRSGDQEYETQHLLLRGKAGEFRAALTVGASRGVAAILFSWTGNCESTANVYAVDGASGNFRDRDCLKVGGPVHPQRFLELAAPDLLAELTARNIVLPNSAYFVVYDKGINTGAFVLVRAVFASDMKLPGEAKDRGDLPAGVRPDTVGWGMRLADAARSSAHSMSGALQIPSVAKND